MTSRLSRSGGSEDEAQRNDGGAVAALERRRDPVEQRRRAGRHEVGGTDEREVDRLGQDDENEDVARAAAPSGPASEIAARQW